MRVPPSDSPSEHWCRHRLPESRYIDRLKCSMEYLARSLRSEVSIELLDAIYNKFNSLLYCSAKYDMKLISPVHQCLVCSHIPYSFPSFAPVVQDRNQVYVLLLCVTESVFLLEWTGILHLFIPISKTAIPVYEWKSLCLPVVCIEFLYPLVWLLLLARKQSKYNCSLSGPPRHWFIHSLLQVGVTNPRGSQPIHTTKI